MERSVAYSLVRRRDFKDPDGNEKEIDAETLSCARNQRCYQVAKRQYKKVCRANQGAAHS